MIRPKKVIHVDEVEHITRDDLNRIPYLCCVEQDEHNPEITYPIIFTEKTSVRIYPEESILHHPASGTVWIVRKAPK